jgi:hypothetical protein
MASLLNKYIYETFKGLIKTLDNEPIDGALKPLSDGEGNELPIKVSETDVEVGFLTSKNLFIEEYGEVIDQNGNWTGPTQGLAGTSGTSGTNGAAGTSGTSGVNGSSGQTGSAGTSGTSGTRGTSGTSGTSGVNGSSGQTGSAGTSGTSGVSALGLPSKVIITDNQGWTFDGNTNTKTFNFGSAFANTNYSVDFTWDVSDIPDQAFSNTSSSIAVNFTNKTTTSITVVLYFGAAISDFTFNGFLTLIASGESNGSGTSGTSGVNGSTGPSGSSGTSGQNGTSGANGTSGTSGISQPGTPGTSGTSGTSGVSNDGTSGTSGTSGVNGISSGQTYYFNQSQNSDVATYKVLATTPNGPQVVTPTTLTNGAQNVLVSQFITPQLGFGVIPGGNQRFYLHYLKPGSNDQIEAYVTIQLADSTGTPFGPVIQSGLDEIGWVDASTPAEVTLDLTLSNTIIDPTNRMIVKLYLRNNDSTTHTVNWYTEGQQYYSFVVTTVASVSGTSGTSGTSGINGLAGTSGTSGTTPSGTITTSGPNTITNVWSGTQAEYTALGTYSATTLYFIE